MLDVLEYCGLVIDLARRVHQRLESSGASVELDDLIQEGSVGLLAAASRYDPARGVQFATFAYRRIQGAIEDYLRRLDPLSQQQRQLVRRMAEARRRQAQSLGREPSADEIAVDFGGDDAGLRQALDLADLAQEALAPTAVDTAPLASSGPGTDAEVEIGALGEDTRHCLDEVLSRDERRVVLLRFWRRLTLERVGLLLGRPLQTIYNIEKRGRAKLRACLENKGWELADVDDLFPSQG